MKYHKLVENAGKPQGFWGKLMLKSMNKGHSKLTDWSLSHIEFQKNYKVLDVGCGGGNTVYKMCQKIGNGKVYGIDYSELCVRKSKKLNEKNLLCSKAKIKQASVSNLPFEDDSLDVVTAVETYYFWPDKVNDIKEIYRVLKIGGKIMLAFEMVEDKEQPNKWEKVENMLSIKAVNEENLMNILEYAGFKNTQAYTKSDKDWLCVTAQK